jgi:predicted DNA-binding antitoxin AbrB/MazE fold protein
MNERIHAIYKNGVFHPLKPLDLPEESIVEIKIIKILGNASEFIKDSKKFSAELDEDELKRLEKILNE